MRSENMLRSLRYRNYRLFFTGQTISLIGTWMQDMALSWLVYRLTGSAFLLGAIVFCKHVPNFLLGPISGVVADRCNRHKIIIITQTLSMVQATILAALVLSGRVEVWQLFSLSLSLGVINAFDITARHAFIIDMVENKADLNNAIALNSVIFNAARLVGPSLAGLLLAIAGEGVCFLINAVSFAGVITALRAMRIKRSGNYRKKQPALREIREACDYAYHFPPIRYTLMLAGMVSFMGLPYTTLMPIFSVEVLGGGPQTLGLLMATIGLGAIIGGFMLASRPSAAGLEKIIPLAAGGFGIGLMIFSQTKQLLPALIILFFSGLSMIMQTASSNTLLQTAVEQDKRGRVMGLYSMAVSGMTPFGNLLAGWLASHIGVVETVFAGGLICLGGGALFLHKLPEIRGRLNAVCRQTGLISDLDH